MKYYYPLADCSKTKTARLLPSQSLIDLCVEMEAKDSLKIFQLPCYGPEFKPAFLPKLEYSYMQQRNRTISNNVVTSGIKQRQQFLGACPAQKKKWATQVEQIKDVEVPEGEQPV
jgi:hypothetical protein